MCFSFSSHTENTCPATNSLCYVKAVVTVVFVSTLCERCNLPPLSSVEKTCRGGSVETWDEGKGQGGKQETICLPL